MTDPLAQMLVGSALAVLFGSAAGHKLRQRRRFQAQLAAYQLLPARSVAAIALLLGLTEAAVAALLLFPALRAPAGAVAAAILALYAGAIAINLWRGRTTIDCGCGDRPVPLSHWLLLRNTLLLAGALTLTLPVSQRALSWPDLLVLLLSLATLLILYRAMEQLLANASAFQIWRNSGD